MLNCHATPPSPPSDHPTRRRSCLVDHLEVLNRHVTGNCSAVVADGDADALAKLAREAAKPGMDFGWAQQLGLQAAFDARWGSAVNRAVPLAMRRLAAALTLRSPPQLG